MSERPYLSIGEVLGLLLEEFPDITISKIRFLESQGLIDPERTPSGYRKFYEVDVERLRFILREQREHYLPLKVIRDRLESGDGDTDPTGMTPPRGIRDVEVTEAAPVGGDDLAGEVPPAATRSHPSARTAARPAERATGAALTATVQAATVQTELAATEPAATESVEPPGVPAASASAADVGSLSREELIAATGIDLEVLRDLEAYGLVAGRRQGDTTVFDPHACEIAEVAARFSRLGIEVRHLRVWRTSVERETGLFEQRVLPTMRQRNPQARDESVQLLRELIVLGSRLHGALVAQQLGQYLDGR